MKKLFSLLFVLFAVTNMSAADGFSFTLSPEEGSEVTKLRVITIASDASDDCYFETVENIAFTYMFSGMDFEYADATAYFETSAGTVEATFSAFPDLYITADQDITAPGECVLVIEKGAIQWGKWNDDYTEWETVWTNEEQLEYTYTIKGSGEDPEQPVDLPFTLNPAAGSTLTSLESVTLDFGTSLDAADINPWNVYFAKDGEKCYEGKTKITTNLSEGKVTLSPVSPITENGTYQLIIKANAMDITGDGLGNYGYYVNDSALSFTYIVDSNVKVNAIQATDLSKDIYNIFGVKVADSMEALQPGIYIVNGKKIVIR